MDRILIGLGCIIFSAVLLCAGSLLRKRREQSLQSISRTEEAVIEIMSLFNISEEESQRMIKCSHAHSVSMWAGPYKLTAIENKRKHKIHLYGAFSTQSEIIEYEEDYDAHYGGLKLSQCEQFVMRFQTYIIQRIFEIKTANGEDGAQQILDLLEEIKAEEDSE